MNWRLSCILTIVLWSGCDRSRSPNREVVLYTSVDEPVARAVIDDFKRATGIDVILKTDTEASKTTGLVQTLRAERANPRADVFWSSEIFHTINLAEEGVLAPYESPSARDVPPQFKDPKSRWAANGLRMKMIARAPAAQQVVKIEDLLDPRLRDRICMANPALGTASGQVASLFVKWGPPKAERFLRDLKANGVILLGGNSEPPKQVAAGTMLAGLTDNDDIEAAVREGGVMSGVPARTADDGALAIPATVGLVAGGPSPDAAKRLIDYLLSPDVEKKLIDAHFAKDSVRRAAGTTEIMNVDYTEVARMMPRAVESARKILEGRE